MYVYVPEYVIAYNFYFIDIFLNTKHTVTS